ncbi:sulfite exporter TauE/SafE family protein [bacterium]|nr:sulfite exporter TauE/SafE family protein [bacterium]
MEMQINHIIILLITGLGAGFAGGLLGVGGCFIMVPIQFWVLTSLGIDTTTAIRIAFGTGLAVVLPTAISSALGHHRKQAVLWKAGVILGMTGFMGAFLGGFIATHIPGNFLKVGFGMAILAGALRMLMSKPFKADREPVDKPLIFMLWGFPLGMVSGMIGIGGGVLMVPVMVHALRFKIHQAVGTSSALMILTSIGAVIAYMVKGWQVSGLPAYSLGYVNLVQWVILAGTSVPMAQGGVKAAHKLPAKYLKWIFIIIMFYMGLKMTGFFSLLHVPI